MRRPSVADAWLERPVKRHDSMVKKSSLPTPAAGCRHLLRIHEDPILELGWRWEGGGRMARQGMGRRRSLSVYREWRAKGDWHVRGSVSFGWNLQERDLARWGEVKEGADEKRKIPKRVLSRVLRGASEFLLSHSSVSSRFIIWSRTLSGHSRTPALVLGWIHLPWRRSLHSAALHPFYLVPTLFLISSFSSEEERQGGRKAVGISGRGGTIEQRRQSCWSRQGVGQDWKSREKGWNRDKEEKEEKKQGRYLEDGLVGQDLDRGVEGQQKHHRHPPSITTREAWRFFHNAAEGRVEEQLPGINGAGPISSPSSHSLFLPSPPLPSPPILLAPTCLAHRRWKTTLALPPLASSDASPRSHPTRNQGLIIEKEKHISLLEIIALENVTPRVLDGTVEKGHNTDTPMPVHGKVRSLLIAD
jgi:hypothetical protein